MSFRYKGNIVNLGNYMSVFSGFEPDVLDEIRSAVLDDTEIGQYIDACRNDSYRLGQARLATRECLPSSVYSPHISGKSLKLIRTLYKNSFDMTPITDYLHNGHPELDDGTMEAMLSAYLSGADITKVDFRVVPRETLSLVCDGLCKGYPVWLCVSADAQMSGAMIHKLMGAARQGVDITPFTSGLWSEEQVSEILVSNGKVQIDSLIMFINHRFTVSQIREVVECARNGLEYDLLCLKDEDGVPVFSAEQMHILTISMMDGALTEDMYDPSLSADDMNNLRLAEVAKKGWTESPDGGFG